MVLIFGGEGQLALCLRDRLKESTPIPKTKCDITNFSEVDNIINFYSPDYVVNCAAYTNVDKCEEETDLAFAVNSSGPANIAKVCSKYRVKLIHISTDYVYDGQANTPYTEDHPTNPLSVYGASKEKGEQLVTKHCPDAIILRTSWLYSEYSKNFVKSMIVHLKNKNEVRVVYDQVGSPTYAGDLAEAIEKIVNEKFIPGIFNFSNLGITSWYDFSVAIGEIKNLDCKVIPICSDEYPMIATRPNYSVFKTNKIRNTFNLNIPHWKESLTKCLMKL